MVVYHGELMHQRLITHDKHPNIEQIILLLRLVRILNLGHRILTA